MNNYKATVIIRLINKTNNPTAPLAFQRIATGVESLAKCLASVSDQKKVLKLQKRLLKDFTNKELNGELGRSSEFIIALLACIKESVIQFQSYDN